ncbi:HNH endonuclease signature motif containing protein [Psychrobacillus sp. OK032]|uniref:HNH endonuclease signature motif containing protein n=1 Tax=Psychrobacillus sp. OK032 TaxID=1884358 RepID=UPI0008C21EEF|nr:HNH endonuclease signature motif containing protein [Psychrobacillus sp. OK032]SER87780.1 HNH endonuclease [Psychrobacillus sp. OK032]
MAWNKGLTKENESVEKYVKYGHEHSQWKGGRTMQSDGYSYIHKELIDPKYFEMVEKSNYILLHRYIMAKHIGRCLSKKEIVHHIDGDNTNNSIDNLEITTRAEHMRVHHPELIVQANKIYRENKEVELRVISELGLVTAQQAAEILGVPHSTIRRRQNKGLLSDIPFKYNGRCVVESELTEHAHLWRKSPSKKKGAIPSEKGI